MPRRHDLPGIPSISMSKLPYVGICKGDESREKLPATNSLWKWDDELVCILCVQCEDRNWFLSEVAGRSELSVLEIIKANGKNVIYLTENTLLQNLNVKKLSTYAKHRKI